jgi:hypothetical protein
MSGEKFFKVSSLYLEARIRIRIKIMGIGTGTDHNFAGNIFEATD